MPQGWEGSPRLARAVEAAARFDTRQAALSDEAARLHERLRREAQLGDAGRLRLVRTLDGMQANRYTVQPLRMGALLSPRFDVQSGSRFSDAYALAGERLGGPWRPLSRVEPEASGPKRPVARRAWRLETSVWAERRRWADSGAFWDTEVSMRRALEADLAVARTGGGLDRLVCRHHLPTHQAAQKAGKGGAPAWMVESLLEQVKAALWKHHEMLYVTFDIYAAVGSGDFTHISINGFKQLLDDVEWIEARADGLSAGIWDGLFVAINSVETVKAAGDQYNHKKGLNRQEFLSFVVRAAILRHINHGTLSDVPEAIEQLVARDLLPKVQSLHPGLAPANDFRDLACYTEATHNVIKQYTPALKNVYQCYAIGKGDVGDKLHDRKLLGLDEWQELLDDLGWLDSQFGERLAGWCFLLSRMRVGVEAELKGSAKLLQLSYEDWLEALVRVAVSKALPTDAECEQAGVADGGEFMMLLQQQGLSAFRFVDLDSFLGHRDGASPLWGGLARQPAHRALEQLLTWLIRLISGRDGGPTSELRLTASDVATFQTRKRLMRTEKEQTNGDPAAPALKRGAGGMGALRLVKEFGAPPDGCEKTE